MPEISQERLAQLEALEAIVREIITPCALAGQEMADVERTSRSARKWTDEQVLNELAGSAIFEDPPAGWKVAKVITYCRGVLEGRGIVGGNLGQYFHKIVKATNGDPVIYWKRWRLGFLAKCAGAGCINGCPGVQDLDLDRVGLFCGVCGTFFSYEQVGEKLAKKLEAAMEKPLS